MQMEEATINWCLGLVLEQLISVRTQNNHLDLQIQNIFNQIQWGINVTRLDRETTYNA